MTDTLQDEKLRDVDALLERAASQIRDSRPADAQVREAAHRVWEQLSGDGAQAAASAAQVVEIHGCEDYQALIPAYLAGVLPEARKLLLEDHTGECVPCRRALKSAREGRPATRAATSRTAKVVRPAIFQWQNAKWGLAAAAILAGLLLAPVLIDQLVPLSGPSATVATLDGDLFRVAATSHLPVKPGEEVREGEHLRTGREGGAVLELRDGTLLEMRARSEIALDESRRGTTVELERGSVIVQAADQRQRHLYVATDDCLVSVTGTIFSVNHGTKGSRVSVIEGEVRVAFSGDEAVLFPGEQLATNHHLAQVPIQSEIDWSRDLDQYLGLLEEYTALRREIRATVPRPGLRYSSRLLDLVPEDTMLYVALPNLGATITETRRVLRERLAESPALAEWWQAQGYEEFEPMADEIVARIGEFGEYLGSEMVVSGQVAAGEAGETDLAGVLVLAEIVDGPGLLDFVERQMADLAGEHGEEVEVVFVDDPFAAADAGDDAIFIWLHSELVAAAPRIETVRQVARHLQGEPNPFTDGSFHHAIAELYAEGADILIAGDLERVVAAARSSEEADDEEMQVFERTGFQSARHLVAEQKRVDDTTHHRLALTFNEERSGIASWLAAPAPMGSLDFISPDAKMVTAFVFKDPVKLLDDLEALTGGAEGFAEAMAIFEERHGLSLRDDFASSLGGEFAFALDGPLVPKPAWKLVLEVYDPARFQWTLEEGLSDLNTHLAAEGQPALELERQESGGRTFYALPTELMTVHYTYVEGYLVMAPDRPLLDRAIRFRDSGYSIADAPRFAALLPDDGRNNFSGVIYQDLGGVMQSVAERFGQGQVSEEQQQVLDELKGEAKPTLGYAYGEEQRIILAAATHGDALSSVLLRLLGLQSPLGFEQVWKETLEGML